MEDLRILETVIAALLAAYLIRPFLRVFRGVDGIFALPSVAFLLTAATVPVFGFRPELVPLAGISFLLFLSSLPRIIDISRRLRIDDYGERRPLSVVAGIVLLALAFTAAFFFAPNQRNGQEGRASAESTAIADDARGVEIVLTLRTAQGRSGPRPVVVFGPSVLGSAGLFDDYLDGLVSQGFSVVSYARPGLDAPTVDASGRIRFPSFSFLSDAFAAAFFGDRLAFGAEAGVRLERERLEDLRFVVDYLRGRIAAGDGAFGDLDVSRITVAGYGIGGAAALLYAAEADPRRIRSVIAMEAPVRSYLETAIPTAPHESEMSDVEEPAALRIARRFLERAAVWIKEAATFRPVRGIARGTTDDAPRVPTMMLVSDWVQEIPRRDRRYGTLVRVLRASPVSSAIVSISGAGSLSYTDIPIDYPIFAFFVRGADRALPFGTSFASRAAILSASFAGSFSFGESADPGIVIEKK